MTTGAGVDVTLVCDAADDAAFFPPLPTGLLASVVLDACDADDELAALDELDDDVIDEAAELLALELTLLDEARGFTGVSSSGGADLQAASVTASVSKAMKRNLL